MAEHRPRFNFDNDVKGTDMNLNHEYLASAQLSARLREAEQCRPGRRLAGALRTSRHAEQLAQQARLALARAN